MKNRPQIKLPFGETVRRSFLYAFVNFDAFVKIAAFWFVILIYEMLFDFPSLCGMQSEVCAREGMQNVSVIMVSMASIAVSVAYCRRVILKTTLKAGAFSFGRQELKYLAYSLLLLLFILLPSVLLMGIAGYILKIIGASSAVSIVTLIPLIIAVVCARFFIILPAVAVDDKELSLREAFELTKGNANKIFWGQALMMLPVIISFVLLSTVYAYLGFNNFVVNLVMAFLLLALSFFDSCLKASYYSHIYQYFTYFRNHPETLPKED